MPWEKLLGTSWVPKEALFPAGGTKTDFMKYGPEERTEQQGASGRPQMGFKPRNNLIIYVLWEFQFGRDVQLSRKKAAHKRLQRSRVRI
jgi:hypothetical protein